MVLLTFASASLTLPGNEGTIPSVTPSVVVRGGLVLLPQLLVLVVFERAKVVLKLSSCSRTSSCSSWKSFHLEGKQCSLWRRFHDDVAESEDAVIYAECAVY